MDVDMGDIFAFFFFKVFIKCCDFVQCSRKKCKYFTKEKDKKYATRFKLTIKHVNLKGSMDVHPKNLCEDQAHSHGLAII